MVVYTKPGCAPCKQLKSWLAMKGVTKYTEIDVTQDEEAFKRLYSSLGSTTVPAVEIDGTFLAGTNNNYSRILELSKAATIND